MRTVYRSSSTDTSASAPSETRMDFLELFRFRGMAVILQSPGRIPFSDRVYLERFAAKDPKLTWWEAPHADKKNGRVRTCGKG